MGDKHRSRRIAGRAGLVAASAALAFTVLSSSVTAAPSLPGWVLLPLEASGMTSSLARPTSVDLAPERAPISLPLDSVVAARDAVIAEGTGLATEDGAEESAKAGGDAFARAASAAETTPQKTTLTADLGSAAAGPAASSDDEREMLVAGQGVEDLPQPPPEAREPEPEAAPDPTTAEPGAETETSTAEPQPQPTTAEPEVEPAPEPSAPEPDAEPEPSAPQPGTEPTDAEPEDVAPEAEPPAAEPTPDPPASAPEPSAPPAPAPSPSATPSPAPSTTPSPEPSETPQAPVTEPTTPPQDAVEEEQAPPPGDTATARSTLLRLVNAHRESNGLPALVYDHHLQSKAQGWADQLISIDAVQHNPHYRSQVGCLGATWGRCSELIVRNTGGANMIFSNMLQSLHTWWEGSPVHNNAMLNPHYTHVGYGFVWSRSGKPYAVAVLAEKY